MNVKQPIRLNAISSMESIKSISDILLDRLNIYTAKTSSVRLINLRSHSNLFPNNNENQIKSDGSSCDIKKNRTIISPNPSQSFRSASKKITELMNQNYQLKQELQSLSKDKLELTNIFDRLKLEVCNNIP